MKNQTRRQFMIDSAKVTGTVIGVATLGQGLLLPKVSQAAEVQFTESNCGDNNKSGQRVLIVYESKCGSTGEVAKTIGEVFCQKGAIVETKYIENVNNLNGFDAVIIGSAIQSSKWMPEATKFVKDNQKTLNKVPVAYFLTCLTLSIKNQEADKKAMAFLNPLLAATPSVKPVSIGRFAGVLDYSKLSFMFRTIMKSKMKKWGIKEGDYRDWDAIRSWAQDTHSKLFII